MGKKRPKAEHPATFQPGPPSPPLFGWLCSQMKADDLSQIASLDYMHDVSQHHAALRRIVAGDVRDLAPLEWHPREVLELARWDEGGVWDEARHRRRLFATTVLLLAAARPENAERTLSINETTIAAAESVLEAFPERADELVQVLDDLMERWRGEDEKPHLMLAKLLLRHKAGASPDELAALIERADKMAGAVREDPCYLWGPVQRAYGWVLDLTNFNQRGRLWKQHLDAVLMDLCAHPETAVAAERLMALRERKD